MTAPRDFPARDRSAPLRAIRVLVVDDSPVMRTIIAAALARDPAIEVLAAVGGAEAAREQVENAQPDVITLDVDMPGMDGLAFLKEVMARRPTPVVMISNLTAKGADIAVEALLLGAVECVGKPGPGAPIGTLNRLPEIVKSAARARLRARPRRPAVAAPTLAPKGAADRLLLIGASTGGVDALAEITAQMPADCPPTLIVQHMPRGYTQTLAARLNQRAAAEVREAAEGDLLIPGRILLAPGGERHLVVQGRGRLRCGLAPGPRIHGHAPSIDRLFDTAAPVAQRVVGVLLTGLGRDGAAGLLSLRRAGARTLGQDERSSVVYGMPRVAMEIGAVERQAPLSEIAAAALALCAEGGR